MSMSIRFEGAGDGADGPFALCNSHTWTEMIHWISIADTGKNNYRNLKKLTHDGYCIDTVRLARELRHVQEAVQEQHAMTLGTMVSTLIDLVGPGDRDETAIIVS